MPPSPALRFSPGREPRADGHKRGRSLESGLLFREKDDDLALFSEMQSKERESFLLQSSDDLEDSFATKLRHISDVNLGISIPARGETSDLLNDGDKNDYDWLLTPPDTPLFPSLDDEPPSTSFGSRGRPQSKPISISRSSTMDKSYRSSRGSASPNRASPNRLSPSPRSGTNTLQSRGRPSSVPNSSPTPSVRYATPTRKPSPPPSKPITPASKYSNYTPRRMSTGSSGSVVSSGVRGTSPVKTNRGNSASPKIRAWQTNIPGFSSEAPPNLRTSIADRPAHYVRGSSPTSRNGRDSTPKFSRQSMSPTASRNSSSFHSHERDQLGSRSKGSIASSGDDDLDSLQSITVGSLDSLSSRKGSGSFATNRTPAISKKSARIMSPSSAPKRSFDSAIRQMDRKTPQNMFRPLLSSVPSTTFYAGKVNSAHRSLVSRNSSVTTSSNASSDQGTNFAMDTEGSDHNQDDMASEADKILYPDIHEEVFAFDKIDALNANLEQEIDGESVDILQNETRDPKSVFGLTESEDSISRMHIDISVNGSSDISHVRGDISETGGFEDTEICSHCGGCYEATNQAEKNIGLCPECSRKIMLLRVIIPETTLAVSEDSSLITTNMPKVEKSSETNPLMIASELPQETNVGDLSFTHERDTEESQTSCSELNQDHLQNNPLPNSLAEGGSHSSGNQLEMNQSGVDYKKPNNEFEDQRHCIDRSNLNMDPMEGTGISVLLERSSSNKGPVVQGRTFTATTISYDDLSFARDSISSFRSSTRPGSYSASSSIDLSSSRQTEFRVQRQSSGRKLDVDSGYDLRIKPPSTASSFSGASIHSRHELGLATRENAGSTDCGFVEEVPQVLQEMPASGNTVTDVIDASSIDLVAEEDKFEYDNSSRENNACGSDFMSQAAAVQSDDNLITSYPNHGDCISDENVDDHPNNVRDVSDTETSAKAAELSSHEKHDVKNSNVNELDALVTTNCSTITESEIEGENNCENNTGMVNGDLSKSNLDDFREPSTQNPSNDCHAASVSELNVSESHGIEGSTVTVECQGTGNTRSLTLEEATDTILFCSSIVHDLAYQAATIAMQKECSDPFEGSEPTVTLLGKTNSDRKDSRSRPASRRTLKPHKTKAKTKQRRVETDVETPSGKTENDENIDETFTHNVGLPNKVDSMKPPKLESKCNCIIM